MQQSDFFVSLEIACPSKGLSQIDPQKVLRIFPHSNEGPVILLQMVPQKVLQLFAHSFEGSVILLQIVPQKVPQVLES